MTAYDHALVPATEAQLFARINTVRRANRWSPAIEQDWAKALEDSLQSYEFTPRCTPWFVHGKVPSHGCAHGSGVRI